MDATTAELHSGNINGPIQIVSSVSKNSVKHKNMDVIPFHLTTF